ncbi:MAG: MiaB/RimO family radical SAM methylthiotransferase, partial [Candidatus Omnitrophica bacterium]|nr:MiaB/RimO family radical SAM methylthiotransferase [Candidatus Omnitrophota bacterium]
QISDFKDHTRAFVKVQDGCDYRCSFCKVWVVRGKSVSRPASEIVEEVRRLCGRGFREIVLTGVSLGLYGRDSEEGLDMMDVVHQLEGVKLLERIRLSSIDPVDVGEVFIEKLLDSQKCCRHLHLSLQSGDDDILARMHRNYTALEYRSIVYKLRKKVPDFSITTDIIVGFPGETEAQFENTLRLVEELRLTRVHLFPYSHREGTVAYRFKDLVPSEVIRSRMKRIEKVAREASFQYRLPWVGKELLVLVESPEEGGYLTGYTEGYVRVLFKGEREWVGKMAAVRIEEVTPYQTIGVLCYTI